MNYYKHHIGDYDANTAHLGWLEDAAYRRLICLYYRREQPVPADVAQACRLVRAVSKPERDAVQSVLEEFFQLTPEGWRHKRCDEEIGLTATRADRNRENGKTGGRPRKVATQKPPEQQPNGNPETTQWVSGGLDGGFTHAGGTNSHKPLAISQDIGRAGVSLEALAPGQAAARSPVEGQTPTPAHPAGPAHPPDPGSQVSTMAHAVVVAVVAHGFDGVSPADPRLLALLGQGATVAEVVAVAGEAAGKGCGWAWVLKAVEGRRRDAAGITLAAVPTLPWHETRSGIEGKGVELGIGRWDELAEQWPTYLARVYGAAGYVAEVAA